jgi:hypothetical protein
MIAETIGHASVDLWHHITFSDLIALSAKET